MIFERNHIVNIKDVGRKNMMTNYAFLSILEEVGSFHSAKCGYGINDMDTKKVAWILMDWKLKVFIRPKYEDLINIKTWARPIEKHALFTYRDFEIYSGKKRIAIATSKWILIDASTKKIVRITDEIFKDYNPENSSVFEENEIKKIKEPDNSLLTYIYETRRSDIDIINHMHNLNYLNLAYEAIPDEFYSDFEKPNVRIMYKHQILLRDKIKCYYSRQNEKEIITLRSEDNKTLHAIIELS